MVFSASRDHSCSPIFPSYSGQITTPAPKVTPLPPHFSFYALRLFSPLHCLLLFLTRSAPLIPPPLGALSPYSFGVIAVPSPTFAQRPSCSFHLEQGPIWVTPRQRSHALRPHPVVEVINGPPALPRPQVVHIKGLGRQEEVVRTCRSWESGAVMIEMWPH
jgi:hypothetical protein